MRAVTEDASPTGRSSRLQRAAPVVALTLVVALVAPVGAWAGNASLRRALATWSQQIGKDARRIGLSATHRHPRRMTRRAKRFRHDALVAKRALAAQRPSTLRGRRAKSLALAAFRDYAIVGREWALSGGARVDGLDARASRDALIARRFARRANRLLLAAGRLLR